jgi:hypothetical protein
MYLYPPEIRKFILDNPVNGYRNYIAKDVTDEALEAFVGEELDLKELWGKQLGREWKGRYDFSQVQERADAFRQRLDKEREAEEEGGAE